MVGVELCLRRNEAVAFVMPYVAHDKFHDYFDKMTARELQSYMRNLVLALKRVHSFGIIHRDVKPSNFLHDRKQNRYLLVDFGLAQMVKSKEEMESPKKLNLVKGSEGRKRRASVDANETDENRLNQLPKRVRLQTPQSPQINNPSHNENENVSEQLLQRSPLPSNNIPSPFKTPLKHSNEISTPKNSKTSMSNYLDSALTRHIKSAVLSYSMNAKLEAQRRLNASSTAGGATGDAGDIGRPQPVPPVSPSRSYNTNKYKSTTTNKDDDKQTPNSGSTSVATGTTAAAMCYCYGKPTVCNICIIKKEIQASRAGTPGYRPPEVLLKYPNQTQAVDMWAIGVIMISIMSQCYPFFKGLDDFSALAEMITVFGDETIRKTAIEMSRHICISRRKLPLHLRKLCIRLRNSRKCKSSKVASDAATTTTTPLQTCCENCQQIPNECLCANTSLNMDFSDDIYPDSAYDLMGKLLTVNPKHRISATEAMEHPFLKDNL